MVQNAGKALKNQTDAEARQAKIAPICMLFMLVFS